MINLTDLVVPSWAKYIAAALAIAALWGHGYTRGLDHAENEQTRLRMAEQEKDSERIQALARRASEIELVWINTTTKITERATALRQGVSGYVTPHADRDCSLTRGLLDLWNADLRAGSTAAPGDPDAASGMALSQFSSDGIVEAKRRFELNKAQLLACQDWVRERGK